MERKMVKYLLISLTLFAYLTMNASIPPQVCPDCVLIYPHDPENGFFNPDSVLIDTTNGINTLYAKGTFSIIFYEMPFSLPTVTGDTLLQFTRFDIDTNYASVRQSFDSLYTLYGNMSISKWMYPTINQESLEYFQFEFEFYVYVPINEVLGILDENEMVYYVTYHNYYADQSDFYSTLQEEIPEGELVIHHRLKDNWHLKTARFPMAFHITQGNTNIVIGILENSTEWNSGPATLIEFTNDAQNELGYGIGDGFNQSQNNSSINYEEEYSGNLYSRIKIGTTGSNYSIYEGGSTSDGNFIMNLKFYNTENGLDYYKLNAGSGSAYPAILRYSLTDKGVIFPSFHGVAVTMTALSKNNGKWLTGSCPECLGIGVHGSNASFVIDVDPYTPGIQSPQILNISAAQVAKEVMYGSMLAGAVPISDRYKATAQHTLKTKTNEFTHQSNDYFQDLKPLGVHPFQDRYCQSESKLPVCPKNPPIPDCIPCENPVCPQWDFRIKLQHNNQYWFQGFSPFDNKLDFNMSDGASDYLPITMYGAHGRKNFGNETKEIIAPQPSVVPWPTMTETRTQPWVPNCYIVGKSYDGGSNSIPVVSGAVGLMLSIDSVLGITTMASENLRYQLPNKVYDIITFTAKKPQYLDAWIDENGELITFRDKNGKITFDAKTTAYINLESTSNDPLKRYFSKYYTFGILNAYRAVAHSFRNKGKSTSYSGSDQLNGSFKRSHEGSTLGYINSENKELLHFGAYNTSIDPALKSVLRYGGDRYDHERIPIFDNCYGTTIINTNLIVGKNDNASSGAILAIDGILKTTTSGQKKISNFLEENQLMISGFMEGICIEGGSIYTDDVHLFNKSTADISEFLFNANKATAGKSYGHGTIYLHDDSKVTVSDDAEFEMTNGSAIYMYDDSEVVIGDGGVLRMDYMTKFKGFNGNKIVIMPGGRLIINSGAVAYFETYIEIRGEDNNPGILELEYNTLVYIDSIVIKPFGKLELNEDAIVMGGEIKERNSLNYLNRKYDGLVVVDTGAELNIPLILNPIKPIALIGGVRVEKGAIFNIAPQAYLHLGPFKVEGGDFDTPGGVMNIHREALVQLFGANNFVKGTFITGIGAEVENPNTWPYIAGFERDHPYACDKPDFFNFAKIEVKHEPLYFGKSILTGLDTLIANKDYLQLVNTNFEHVGFKGINALTNNPILGCNFKTDSEKIRKAHDDKYLNQSNIMGAFLDFEILSNSSRSLRVLGLPDYNSFEDNWQRIKSISSYRNTTEYKRLFEKHFLNNNFEDENPEKVYITRQGVAPDGEGYYRNMTGIKMDGISYATVHGEIINDVRTNSFKNLFCGVWYENGLAEVKIKNYYFNTCETGVNAIMGSVNTCNNLFQETTVGMALSHNLANISYDNKYITTQYAVILKNARQTFRGDKFTDFQSALRIYETSQAILSGRFYSQRYNHNAKDFGRCEFDYANLFFEPPSMRTERFMKPLPPVLNREHGDIVFADNTASVNLKCGYNLFSRFEPLPPTPLYAINHLSTTDKVTVPIGPIYTLYNEWRPDEPGLVKHYINIIADPLNPPNASEFASGCESSDFQYHEDCYEPPECPDCVPDLKWLDHTFTIPNIEFLTKVGGLVEPFSEVSENYNQYLIRDVMLYAILADSTEICLQIFIDTLSTIIADTTFPEFYRDLAYFYIGESYERLGDINSANSVYNDFLATNPSENVMMTLDWRLRYNQCFEVDSTMGPKYDSCRYAYMNKVIYDLTKSSILQAPKVASNETVETNYFSFEIELVKPNPFSEKTDIQYYISEKSKVKLSVHDIFGRELIRLIDNKEQQGNHTITLDGNNLPNGVYLLILQADGITKSVTLIKYN
jgi:hypothetical protein